MRQNKMRKLSRRATTFINAYVLYTVIYIWVRPIPVPTWIRESFPEDATGAKCTPQR